jgi:hypothetical protein
VDVPETDHATSGDDVSLATGPSTVKTSTSSPTPRRTAMSQYVGVRAIARSLARAVVVAPGIPIRANCGRSTWSGSHLLQVTHRLANNDGLASLP